MTPEVHGPNHARVIELRRLIGRRSSRSGEVVLEGPRTVGEALDAGLALHCVVVPESAADEPAVVGVVARLGADVEHLVVRDKAFTKMAPTVTPQPMLAIADRPAVAVPEVIAQTDVILVLVEVGDPGNVGTLVRVAEAVGAAGVIVCGGADPWGDKALRASAGSVMRVPVVSGIETEVALSALRAAGVRIVGTDVREGEPHDEGVLAAPVAILLGSEPHGLDRSLGPLVDAWARIDMPGNTESLNVAMAGTLLAYEARRSASSG